MENEQCNCLIEYNKLCEKCYKHNWYLKKLKYKKENINLLKICKVCKKEESIINFYGNLCKDCRLERRRFNRQKNKKNNKIKICKYCSFEGLSCLFVVNENKCIKCANKYRAFRKRMQYKNDILYKIKRNVARYISLYITNKKSSKSILKYLPYTINELKQHLESLFEPWMNWENHGVYNSNTWNDDNSLTWTWHVDHIIPQSHLPYDSMEHPNFQKCWALENLRPYSAKQNIIDGNRR